jgi:hypothetical protein
VLLLAEVVSWNWPTISHCDPQRLVRAVEVPVQRQTLRGLCTG